MTEKRKVRRLTEKTTVGFSFTTNDLISFRTNTKAKKLIIDNLYVGQEVTIELTRDTVFMLGELFRHVLADMEQEDDQIKTQ